MTQTPRLLLVALLLLWLQLLLHGQLQAVVAISLPGLMLLRWRLAGRTLARPWLLTIAAALLLAWGADQGLNNHSGLLPSVSNLLWLMLGVQQLEAQRHGQQQRSALLLLLGIGLAGVEAQGLAASLVQGATALLTLAALLSLETGGQRLLPNLRRTAFLIGIALPLLAASFVLLPRLEPLWSLPSAQAGRTGLSAQLAPGELAALVQDNGLAARVGFGGKPPPISEQRYWRVIVHQRFNGRAWSAAQSSRRSSGSTNATQPVPQLDNQQRWIVEPNGLEQRPWDGRSAPLASTSPPLQITDLGTLTGPRPMAERQLYALVATPSAAGWQRLPPTPDDLQYPTGTNPRLQALGQAWARQGSSPDARINLAREWFEQQGFTYTLQPGALGPSDPLDRFLFETRRGFCEHYAASFSALMRAAGIPARVVVGYQGGSWQLANGGAGFLELRNSDAHAWSEVWLPGRGWVNVDPTAWIVPERVRRSLAESLDPSDRQRLAKPIPDWLQGVVTQWRGLDFRWQLWVMGFDRQQQVAMFGRHRWQGLMALGAMGLTLAAGLFPLWWQRPRGDQPRRWLDRIVRQLQRKGYPLTSGETLEQLSERVAQAEPQLGACLQQLGEQYNQWRFAPPEQVSNRAELLRSLQRSVASVNDCLGRVRKR